MTGFRCKPERNPLRLLVGLLDFIQKRVARFDYESPAYAGRMSGALFGGSVVLLCIPVLSALSEHHTAGGWILFVPF